MKGLFDAIGLSIIGAVTAYRLRRPQARRIQRMSAMTGSGTRFAQGLHTSGLRLRPSATA